MAIAEASALPVSDKPVTLSFNKGGLALNKSKADGSGTLFSHRSWILHLTLCPAAKAGGLPSTSLAMGDDDAEDEADEQAKTAAEAKGLSYSQCRQRSFWTYMLMMLDAQWLRPGRWLP